MFRKIIVLLLCLVLISASSVAAASDIAVNPAGSLPIVDEKIEITAYFEDNTSWMDLSDNNRALQKYENDTNVHLNLVFGDLKVLIAANDYPEIAFSAGLNNQEIMDYASQGILLPLNDLIDEYCVFLKKAQEEYYPHMWEDLTSPDGNIYGISTQGSSYGGRTQKAYINVNWLDELGLSMPTTTDEFKDVLTAFKNRSDESIPYTGAINTWWGECQYFLINPFILCDQQNAFLNYG